MVVRSLLICDGLDARAIYLSLRHLVHLGQNHRIQMVSRFVNSVWGRGRIFMDARHLARKSCPPPLPASWRKPLIIQPFQRKTLARNHNTRRCMRYGFASCSKLKLKPKTMSVARAFATDSPILVGTLAWLWQTDAAGACASCLFERPLRQA